MKPVLSEKELLSTDVKSPLFNNAACFTGHRKNVDKEGVELMQKAVDFALSLGYTTFLCGMALGFDSIAFDYVLEKKKKHKNIKLVACVPCLEQEKFFPEEEKKKYRKRIEKADLTLVLSGKYQNGCMQARNRFMVDRASLLIAYLREETGGTGYTVKYAQNAGRSLITV